MVESELRPNSKQGKMSAMDGLKRDIAAIAAQLVVDKGLDFGAAKRRACEQLGASLRTALPDNDLLEAAIREHIAIFHAETQPKELAALRRLALEWMEGLAEFHPHVTGAVWSGVATRQSDIYLQLFCVDSKSAELQLINDGIRFDTALVRGFHGKSVNSLIVAVRSIELVQVVGIHLTVYDYDDLRGALRIRVGRWAPRGDRQALLRRMAENRE